MKETQNTFTPNAIQSILVRKVDENQLLDEF